LKKKFIRISALLLISSLLFIYLFNSPATLSKNDRIFLKAFLSEWKIDIPDHEIHQSQQTELNYVKLIQERVLSEVCNSMNTYDSVGNVQYYFRQKKGLCYDRSMLLEKFYLLAGFSVRHIYIYFDFNGKDVARRDFFKSYVSSHALLEVKTKEGWMVVGSNSNWIGLDTKGQVLTIGAIRDKLIDGSLALNNQPSYGLPFYQELPKPQAFRYVYGLYSRHGGFLKSAPLETALCAMGIRPHIPDYNFRMLLYNL